MLSNVICPISSERVDSNVSRLTVFTSAVLMIVFLVTQNPLPIIIVAVDCFARAMGRNDLSVLCLLSNQISKLLGWKRKLVNKAPKVFASRLGLICGVLGVAFHFMGFSIAASSVIGMFTVLALLDSLANFCVGCLIYHTFVLPFYKEADQT